MANNYVQFSEMIEIDDTDARENLYKRIVNSGDEDSEASFICNVEQEGVALWLYADDYGDLGALWYQIEEWQKAYDITFPFSMTWSETCSYPRLGEFGGGWSITYKGCTIAGTTWDAVADALQELLKEDKDAKSNS